MPQQPWNPLFTTLLCTYKYMNPFPHVPMYHCQHAPLHSCPNTKHQCLDVPIQCSMPSCTHAPNPPCTIASVYPCPHAPKTSCTTANSFSNASTHPCPMFSCTHTLMHQCNHASMLYRIYAHKHPCLHATVPSCTQATITDETWERKIKHEEYANCVRTV